VVCTKQSIRTTTMMALEFLFFLLGRVFASRLIKAHEEKKREKDLISISEPMDRRDCLHLFTK
jgi:hypothetical protein